MTEDDKKNKSKKDSGESRMWPPKKSFLDITKSSNEEKPKPLEELSKPEKSDKPSFMSLTGALTSQPAESQSQAESQEESFPWGDSGNTDESPVFESSKEGLPWANEETIITTNEDLHSDEKISNSLKEKFADKNKYAEEELSLTELFSEAKEQTNEKSFFSPQSEPEEVPVNDYAGDAREGEQKADEVKPILAAGASGGGDDTDDFLSSLREDPNDDDDNPYRAYAYYDFLQAELTEEPVKPGLKLNRQAIILIAAVFIAGGWFAYQKFSEGRYKFASQRERKRPERQKIIPKYEEQGEELPLWAITKQEIQKTGADREVILKALANSGRDNPFAVPEAVLKLIKQDIEKKIAQEKPPEILKKTAYRGALVGVIRSAKGMLAIATLKTAQFDITEGTAKPKIIQEAIKSMTRVEDESLEVVPGDTLGPWNIVSIDDGRDSGLEASMVIERNGEQKTLRIGVPVELGIYDEAGNLDIYKEAEK